MTAAPPPYTTRRATEESDLAACFQVRKEVFVGEQNVAEEIEYDAYDLTAVHVLAVAADGTALGTGRLLHGGADVVGKPAAHLIVGSLGRLAVTRQARGLGVGAALVRAIEDEAAARPGRRGPARTDARPRLLRAARIRRVRPRVPRRGAFRTGRCDGRSSQSDRPA
ncbi:hypothetical protein SMICM17S_10395 [Streptomyces microflavus]